MLLHVGIKCTKIPLENIAAIDFLMIKYYIEFKNKHNLYL